MVDMIVNQGFLCLSDCLFDRMELLRQIEARPLILDHFDHVAEVPLGTTEPPGDFGMRLMNLTV
jgi:hypothetical protein